MREIKFRAWDKVEKVMIEHDDKHGFYICNEYGNITFPIKTPDEYRIPFGQGEERFELMQFTGLHDCNGKEIYEGDIVKRLNWEYAYIVKHDDERTGFYYHDHSNLDDDHMSMIMSRENLCEVIGNLYENPELVEN